MTNRALEDPGFAKALLASRKAPALCASLLSQQPDIAQFHPDQPDQGRAPSAAKLIGKAASATLKWGMEGLKHAKPWVIEKRLAARKECEFIAKAPTR